MLLQITSSFIYRALGSYKMTWTMGSPKLLKEREIVVFIIKFIGHIQSIRILIINLISRLFGGLACSLVAFINSLFCLLITMGYFGAYDCWMGHSQVRLMYILLTHSLPFNKAYTSLFFSDGRGMTETHFWTFDSLFVLAFWRRSYCMMEICSIIFLMLVAIFITFLVWSAVTLPPR